VIRLGHIGIAVANLADSLPRFAHLLGCDPDEVRTTEVPEEGVRIAELELGSVQLELLEPLAAENALGRFLRSRGAGVHHLCFEVDDIHATWERLKSAGLDLLSSKVKSVRDYQYFFVHPRSAGGVLTEFKQGKGE